MWPWSWNEGCSGQAPLSSTPKMTPVPARRSPPSAGYTLSAPMKPVLSSVSSWFSSSFCTATTLSIARISSTVFAGTVTATPP